MTLSSLFSHFQFLFSEIVAITALANCWLSITLSVTVSLNLNLNCYWKANSWIQSNKSCKWHALTLGTCFTNWKMMIIWSFFRAKEIVNLPVSSRGFPRSLFSIIQWFFLKAGRYVKSISCMLSKDDCDKCACSEFMCCSWYFLYRCSSLLRLPGPPRLPPPLRRRKHPHSSPLRIMCQ